jgi:hypothetical protein
VKVFLTDGKLSKPEQSWVADNFGVGKLHSLINLFSAQNSSDFMSGINEKIATHQEALENASPAARREYERLISRLKDFGGSL